MKHKFASRPSHSKCLGLHVHARRIRQLPAQAYLKKPCVSQKAHASAW